MTTTARQLGWAGDAPGAAGALLLGALISARSLASATAERVYLLGYEAHWPCFFSQLFSLPCPGCGLTRGSLLTLDGRISEAFALNPAAPLFVLGVALFAVALLALALLGRTRSPFASALLRQRIRTGVRLYGALLGAVLLVNWIAALLRA